MQPTILDIDTLLADRLSHYEPCLATPRDGEREPVCFFGHVQAHAVLLGAVVHDGDLVLRYVSENTEEHLGVPARALLGRSLSSLLTPATLACIGEAPEPQQPFAPRTLEIRLGDVVKPVAGCFHWQDGVLIIELDAADIDATRRADVTSPESSVVNRVIRAADEARSLEQYCQALAAYLRDVTGYDRVMVYRFCEDGHGEVIAESRPSHLESFLGLNYPASHVPGELRPLYVLNRCRTIADVQAPEAKIVSDDCRDAAARLDLRFSVSRGSLPDHVKYLQNMTVGAAAMISLVTDEQLWGMVMFHHCEPRYCTPRLRALLHDLSDTCSTLLGFMKEREGTQLQDATRSLENLLSTSLQQDDPTQSLVEALPEMRRMVQADGVIVKLAGTPALHEGLVPEAARFSEEIAAHPTLGGFTDFTSTHLARNLPRIHELEPTLAGLYFEAMSDDLEAYVVWFRQEKRKRVRWAGRKEAYLPGRDGRLHPRHSFEVWKESVIGESEPWSEEEIFAMKQVKAMLLRFQLRIRDAQLARLGQFDSLTQLPNRVMFLRRLASRVEQAQQRGDRFSIMFVDLDRFKNINDSLGHNMGDRVLVEFAKRLRGLGLQQLFVARLGGDEFTVLIDEICEGVGEAAAQDIVTEFQKPVAVDSFRFHIPVSVGVAHYERGATLENLMRDADSAMYSAKARGGNCYCVSSPQIRSDASARLDLEQSLHDAVERGEIHALFQPIIKAGTREVAALEALLRWSRPTGMVPPGKFLDIAESTGLILPVGQELIRQTFRFAELVVERAGPAIAFNINLSARQLLDDATYELLLERIGQSIVPAENICIEVTEHSHIVEEVNAHKRLSEMREHGMKVALDDFGAGYSSISYLQTLPIDIVKFDRAFLLNLGSQARPQQMLQACRQLADACGLESVVEGIETAEHARLLDGIGFDYYQGYLFGRPMTPDNLLAYLADQNG